MYKFPEHVTPLARDLIGKVRWIKTFLWLGWNIISLLQLFSDFLGLVVMAVFIAPVPFQAYPFLYLPL